MASTAPERATSTPFVNAMSVDVEDYFHVSALTGVVSRASWDALESRVCANTDRLLDLFAACRVRATFFVLGWVAERHPDLVRRIAQAGHEVASHGYGHGLIYEQTPADFRDDIRRAKRLLEEACGAPVVGYRAPSFSITRKSLWALDVLIDEGYRYDSSIVPIYHDRYGVPGAEPGVHRIQRQAGELTEVPPSTVCLGPLTVPVGGGGYFRLLPYSWTRFGLARVNRRERRPAVFYLHPWEIDAEQPRFNPGLIGRIRHYTNLDKTHARLTRLLRDFSFDTIRSVIEGTCISQPMPSIRA